MKTISLFIPYYNCGHAARQKEIDFCLSKCVNDRRISRIYTLIDDNSALPIRSNKIKEVKLNSRPTYRDWLEYSLKYCRDSISILANSDIYFHSGLEHIEKYLGDHKSFLALSRWDFVSNDKELSPHPNPHWSQDVWAIDTSHLIEEKSLFAEVNFQLGIPRCDNRIAFIFSVRGWKVVNPFQDIISVHVHETKKRFYDKADTTLLGGTAYVWPAKPGHLESEIEYDVWSIQDRSILGLALNRSLNATPVSSSPLHVPNASAQKINPIQILLKQRQQAKSISAPKVELIIEETSNQVALKAMQEGWRLPHSNPSGNMFLFNGAFYFNIPSITHRFVAIYGKKRLTEGDLSTRLEAIGWAAASLAGIGLNIANAPNSENSLHFWQFPALTEKQAYANHYPRLFVENKNDKNVLSCFIPVPWATYVDKNTFPNKLFDPISTRIAIARQVLEQAGMQLHAHTMCQHIHWRKAVPTMHKIGIDHLHLSHKQTNSTLDPVLDNTGIQLHGWPLISVNREVRGRQQGLSSKTMDERSLLASFIGAHMDHYIDRSRPALLKAARQANRDDVIVELDDLWHFNKIVYNHQILGQKIAHGELSKSEIKTLRYNKILSDSRFALCPVGAGPNTLRLWEAISIGTIPVIFNKNLAILEESEYGSYLLDNVILWEKPINATLFEHLSRFSVEQLEARRLQLLDIYIEFERKRCF